MLYPHAAGKNDSQMSDLYEDFFQCKGKWKRSRTYSSLVHKSRSRRSLKKVWKTKAQLLVQ